jgi:hypothetical protein
LIIPILIQKEILTHKTSNIGFGNLSGLRPIINNTTTTTTTNQNDNDNNKIVEDDSAINNNTFFTKIMKITPQTYERLKDFSHKYHSQPISYDEIFQELLNFYNKEHDQKYFLT